MASSTLLPTGPTAYGNAAGVSSASQISELRNQIAAMQNQMNTSLIKGPNGQMFNPDGSPARPDIISVVNPDGTLKSGMAAEFQTLDPNSLEGFNMLKLMATAPGQTQYAQSQNNLANQLKENNLNSASRQSNQAMNQALNTLSMRGGAGSGARANLASTAARDLLNAKQGVNLQNTTDLMKIDADDQSRKLDLFKNFADAESKIAAGNVDIKNKQTEFNKNLQGLGIENVNRNTMDAYTSELDRWGANKQADATARSSGGGGGGCCFIFLEARYGNGTMDKVVRRFRDENMNAVNRRGYYKVSEVLVPLMRRHAFVKFLVRATLTTPLVIYGKAHYGEDSLANKSKRLLFAPLKNFWLKTFEFLGGDHEFVRENGETV